MPYANLVYIYVPVESRIAQLEAMQSSKQSDFERDSERDSARNAKVLSNPTTLVRAPAPSANAGAALRVLPNTKRRARAVFSGTKWLRGTPKQRFRAAGESRDEPGHKMNDF